MSAKNEVRLLALTEEGKENTEAVCKLLIEQNLKSTWIDAPDALAITEFEEDVIYVVDPTEGREVDHLVDIGFSVIGPQCAMTVLKHNIQLKKELKYPVHNLTMLDCLVCFSNIEPKKRNELKDKVERMGGKSSGLLTQDVSHLVVKEVGSVKYFSAAHVSIPIMTMEWIDHLWKRGQSRYISAKDGKWEEFRCPIFLGCSVCVTGFNTNERNRIQKLVTKFGGTYSGAMKLDFTTHLVVNKPEGQKYAMANKFGVKVVSLNWVYNSVEKGSCQDHSKYPVKPASKTDPPSKPHSSTPERHDTHMRIPSIQDMSNISVLTVNETVAPSMADVSRLSTICPPQSYNTAHGNKEDLWSFSVGDEYEQVLDGISVYVVGFSAREEEKLRQLLSISGATRLNQMTFSVTHVIVGSASAVSEQSSTIIHAAINKPGRELWVVSYKWLLHSLCKAEIVSEIDYWMNDVASKPAHLDKNDDVTNIDDADQTTIIQPATSTQIEVKDNAIQNGTLQESNMSAMHDVLSQYMDDNAVKLLLNDEEGDTTLLRNFDMEPVPENLDDHGYQDDKDETRVDHGYQDDKDETRVDHGYQDDKDETHVDHGYQDDKDETHVDHDERMDDTDATSIKWSIFRGKTFLVLGFDDEETEKYVENIESLEGRLMPSYSKRIADYAVVPITGYPVDRTVQNIVTDFWIDLCINNGTLMEVNSHDMCTPFDVPDDATPLEGCVTCLSKYQEPERSHLVALIQELGGIYQDNVARKDMPNEGMQRTTHLIVMSPEGDKYVGSKKWGIHTVTAEWVLECASRGVKAPESQFLVDKIESSKQDANKLNIAEISRAATTSTHRIMSAPTLSKSSPNVDETAQSGSKLEFPPMPRPPSVVDHIRRRLEAKAEAQRAKDQRKETPLRERFLRLNVETPSKFIAVGANPNISFQLDEVFALLKTPVQEQKKMKDAMKSNPATPLSEFVERFLAESLKDQPDVAEQVISNLENAFEKVSSEDEDDGNVKDNEIEMQVEQIVDETKVEGIANGTSNQPVINRDVDNTEASHDKPLHGVVVYACKKLNKQRMDLSDVILKLGGEFRWMYDGACTHFVFQGKQNDTNREFRSARSDGKIIVSPHWVTACQESGSREDESDYPHVYNPNKSIQMVPTFTQPKSQRRTTRSSIKPDTTLSKSSRSTRKKSSTDSDQDATNVTTKIDVSRCEASQEARDSLKKTLENIMSSTNKHNRGLPTRMSCSRAGGYASPAHLAPPRGSPLATNGNQSTNENEKAESSQDVHVVWDDPIGREELERMRKEKDGGQSSSNSETANPLPPEESSNEKSIHDEDVAMTGDKNAAGDQSKPAAADMGCLSQIIREGRTPTFLISSVTPQQKIEYAAIIESLGGIYLDRDYFDSTCTHLIVKKPARNEKFLASLSSGKWILHTSYIEACKEAGAFVKEDPHEYGNPSSHWKPTNETEASLICAAYRWRRSLNQMRTRGDADAGAFSNWNVILHVNDRQTPGFVRLLQSGSGRVVTRSLPYHGPTDEVTHAILDPNKIKQLPWSEIEVLANSGVHCCVPEYIADFLMKDPQPPVQALYLPRVAAMLREVEQEGTPRKRRKLK